MIIETGWWLYIGVHYILLFLYMVENFLQYNLSIISYIYPTYLEGQFKVQTGGCPVWDMSWMWEAYLNNNSKSFPLHHVIGHLEVKIRQIHLHKMTMNCSEKMLFKYLPNYFFFVKVLWPALLGKICCHNKTGLCRFFLRQHFVCSMGSILICFILDEVF